MKPLGDIFHKIFHHHHATHYSRWPKSFEELGQSYGLLFYQTTLKELFTDPALLKIEGSSPFMS